MDGRRTTGHDIGLLALASGAKNNMPGSPFKDKDSINDKSDVP